MGQHDLAPVRGSHQSTRAVEGGAEVVAIALLGGSRVYPYASAQRAGRAPHLGEERAYRVGGGHDRVDRFREHRVDAVTGRLDDVAVFRLDRLAQDRVVTRECVAHCIGMLFPQSRRALEIGEEERHHPRRQSAHSPPLVPAGSKSSRSGFRRPGVAGSTSTGCESLDHLREALDRPGLGEVGKADDRGLHAGLCRRGRSRSTAVSTSDASRPRRVVESCVTSTVRGSRSNATQCACSARTLRVTTSTSPMMLQASAYGAASRNVRRSPLPPTRIGIRSWSGRGYRPRPRAQRRAPACECCGTGTRCGRG